jgi:hypothetical protein
LAREGYGTVEGILEMRADLVLAALEYCSFLDDYHETFLALNRDQSK